MPYEPHTLVTFGGSNAEIGTSDEIWECGVRGFNNPPSKIPVGESQLQNLVDALATNPGNNIPAWFQLPHSYIATTAHLEWIKAVNIAPDGSYSSAPAVHELSPAVAGAVGASAPSFLSCVLGWQTSKRFGLARSGRIYPPNYGTPLAAGAKIDATAQSNLAATAVALLDILTLEGDEFAFQPYVVSRSGVSNVITGARVSNIWDVQRRRKNATPPTYIGQPL